MAHLGYFFEAKRPIGTVPYSGESDRRMYLTPGQGPSGYEPWGPWLLGTPGTPERRFKIAVPRKTQEPKPSESTTPDEPGQGLDARLVDKK